MSAQRGMHTALKIQNSEPNQLQHTKIVKYKCYLQIQILRILAMH